MTDETSPGQAVALAEIRTLEAETPFGSPGYNREVDQRRQQLYARAYPEPPEEGEAPAGRQFPEQHPRRDARQRDPSKPKFEPHPETSREIARQADRLAPDDARQLRADFDEWVSRGGEDDDEDAPRSFPLKAYVPQWGAFRPSFDDEAQWTKVARKAAEIGVSPQQLAELHAVILQDAPDPDDDTDSPYEPSDYPVPVSIGDDQTWNVFKVAREIASEHGVDPKAFRAMAAAVLTANSMLTADASARAQKQAVSDLVDNVGEDRALDVVRNAQKAFDHFAPTGPEIDRLMGTPISGGLVLGNHPILVEFLGNVGAAIAYDALPGEMRSPTGIHQPPASRKMGSHENVKAQIKQLEAAAPLGRRSREQDAEIQRLYAVLYDGGEEDATRSQMGSLWKGQ